jgi:hypothetical protein
MFDPDANRAGRWKGEEETCSGPVVEERSQAFMQPKAKVMSAPFVVWDEVGQSEVSSSSGSEERDDSSCVESFDKAANVVTKIAAVQNSEDVTVWKLEHRC